MNNENLGVIAKGVKCPIIREGSNIVDVVVSSLMVASNRQLKKNDVVGITESVIARSAGLYVTVDDIANDIRAKFGNDCEIILDSPIYSRNRFAMILKGIARAAKKLYICMPPYDEVGNPSGINPFTGINIQDYYAEICANENCDVAFNVYMSELVKDIKYEDLGKYPFIYCGLHDYAEWKLQFGGQGKENHISLADICSDKCEFGVLGSNKATEEKIKLFPTKKLATEVCEKVKAEIKRITGVDVIVMAYGDGSYKDLDAGIWEMADPVSSPGYTNTDILNSAPNELKLKSLIDNSASNAEVRKILGAKKESNNSLKGKMSSMGTTPRRYVNLLASLMDLVSGSGDRETPVVWISNYFNF